jgi:FAD/FMN-containing dehydrogenase
MPTISAPQKQAIENIVTPERARFDARERRVYSHDTGVLPGPFKLLAGPSLADGVVQPETEDQVVRLVRFAVAEGIPLVPRGKATSGYGGAIPAQGGLVLDLTRLKGIIWTDTEDLTVTVRAGTVWQDLEEALAVYGLALRLYPTSARLDRWRLARSGRRGSRQPCLRLVCRQRPGGAGRDWYWPDPGGSRRGAAHDCRR